MKRPEQPALQTRHVVGSFEQALLLAGRGYRLVLAVQLTPEQQLQVRQAYARAWGRET